MRDNWNCSNKLLKMLHLFGSRSSCFQEINTLSHKSSATMTATKMALNSSSMWVDHPSLLYRELRGPRPELFFWACATAPSAGGQNGSLWKTSRNSDISDRMPLKFPNNFILHVVFFNTLAKHLKQNT